MFIPLEDFPTLFVGEEKTRMNVTANIYKNRRKNYCNHFFHRIGYPFTSKISAQKTRIIDIHKLFHTGNIISAIFVSFGLVGSVRTTLGRFGGEQQAVHHTPDQHQPLFSSSRLGFRHQKQIKIIPFSKLIIFGVGVVCTYTLFYI
jgi:hypothetical protein